MPLLFTLGQRRAPPGAGRLPAARIGARAPSRPAPRGPPTGTPSPGGSCLRTPPGDLVPSWAWDDGALHLSCVDQAYRAHARVPHLIDDRFLWLDRLRRLNPNRSRTKGAAPHKPCLLLCLLDMAQDGELPSPEFTSQRQHPIINTHLFIRQVGDKSGWLSSSSLSAKHAKLLEKPNGKRDS